MGLLLVCVYSYRRTADLLKLYDLCTRSMARQVETNHEVKQNMMTHSEPDRKCQVLGKFDVIAVVFPLAFTFINLKTLEVAWLGILTSIPGKRMD